MRGVERGSVKQGRGRKEDENEAVKATKATKAAMVNTQAT